MIQAKSKIPAWKRFYLKNAEKIKARRMERYYANPEPDKKQATQWMKDNRNLANLQQRTRYWEDVERYRKKARASMAKTRARRKAERAA